MALVKGLCNAKVATSKDAVHAFGRKLLAASQQVYVSTVCLLQNAMHPAKLNDAVALSLIAGRCEKFNSPASAKANNFSTSHNCCKIASLL